MEVAALGLRVDGAEGIERAGDALSKLTKASESAERSTEGLSKGADKAKKSTEELGGSSRNSAAFIKELSAAAFQLGKVLGAAIGLNALKNYADSWSDMQSQVGAATHDMAGAAAMMRRLTDIANASYSPLQQTAEGYARNVATLRDLGKSSSDAANYTESLNHMLVLTATRGERAASVQNALSKAMAVGKLDAMGLETVLANGGEVAQALANELKTTVSGLRAMAAQGKITGKVIADAIIKPLDDVRERAAEMPATLADAFVRINNNLTEFVGRLDKASGTSEFFASVMIRFADGIRKAGDYILAFGAFAAPAFDLAGTAISAVAGYADIAVAALAGFYAPALIGGIAILTRALAVGLVGAIRAVTAAMLANPVGMLVAAIVSAGYAVYKFSEDIHKAIGVDVVEVFKRAANYVIGSFVAAYEDIKFVWSNFGDMMGAAVVGGVNLAIRAINGLISAATSGIDGLIDSINSALGTNITSLGAAASIPEFSNEYADRLTRSIEDRNKAIADALSKDYLGGMFGGAASESSVPADSAGGNPAAPAASTGKASELARLVKQLEIQKATLGMTTEQAARYEIETAKGTKADRARALALFDQIHAWNETEKAMKAAIDSSRQYLAFQREMEVFQQKMDLSAAAVGMGDRQRELAEQSLAIRQEYAQKRLDLEMAQQVKETALSQEQYQERLALLQQFEEQKLAITQESAEARAAAEADWTNGMIRSWENFAERSRNIAAQTESLFSGMLGTMTTGFGDAFESIIIDSEDAGDAMKKLAQNMLRSVVNALGQMAAQWLAYQAVQLLVGKTTQASGAVALSANAYATAMQAGLAAFASTAAIPIVGPAAAPAAMAGALAVTLPMAAAVTGTALAGMAHDGIDSVPATGTWLLEKGERVTTAKTSARLDSVLERIDARQRGAYAAGQSSASQQGKGMTVNIIENPDKAGQTEVRRNTNGDEEADVFVADIFGGGKRAQAVERAYGLRRIGT